MRIRLAACAVVIWSFGVNLALQKGLLDWVPNPVIYAMLGLPAAFFFYYALTHISVRNYFRNTRPMSSLLLFVLSGAIIGALVWGGIYLFSHREKPSAPPSFAVSVQDFGYDDDKQQLEALLAFDNRDPVTRVVLSIQFFYRTKEQKESGGDEMKIFTEGHRNAPLLSPEQEPIYVQQNTPVLKRSSTRVAPELFKQEGNVFGVYITTLTKEGGQNLTMIEVMYLAGGLTVPPAGVARVTGRKNNEPLDVPWYQSRVEISKPSNPPTTESAPTAATHIMNLPVPDSPKPSPAREVAPKLVPPPSDSPQVMSSLGPSELFSLIEGRTPLEAVTLIEPYKGLWTEVEGETMHSPLPHGGGCVTTLPLKPGDKQVECRFEKRWCDQLDRLRDKEIIKVRGKIGGQFGGTLALEECELISPALP